MKRLYTFNNFYISSIQAGIQSLHVVAEMFIKYGWQPNQTPFDVSKFDQLIMWAKEHKTVVLLNGGDAEALADLRTFLNTPDNPYPHAYFEESPGAMNGCLTSVGIVLPERMYDASSTRVGKQVNRVYQIRKDMVTGAHCGNPDYDFGDPEVMKIHQERQYSEWELQFLGRRVQCDLAK